MSTWRRQALSFLPEFRETIESSENPMALWIELRYSFREAMASEQSELVGRFMRFAAWCISEQSGKLPNDTSTAAALAFYEHLPVNRAYWPHFKKWFASSEFEALLPIFSYHMKPQELSELKQSYASRA
jgi:hypothetical protein